MQADGDNPQRPKKGGGAAAGRGPLRAMEKHTLTPSAKEDRELRRYIRGTCTTNYGLPGLFVSAGLAMNLVGCSAPGDHHATFFWIPCLFAIQVWRLRNGAARLCSALLILPGFTHDTLHTFSLLSDWLAFLLILLNRTMAALRIRLFI